jgi:hypothetical protein
MLRIGFLATGPQKTATTWLDAVLRCHAEVELPSPMKETFFFDRHFVRGWDWYEGCFAGAAKPLRGEIGASYFSNEQALRRIKEGLPRVKILMSLREPVERAYSQFKHHHRKGRVGQEFWEATEMQPDILEAGRYATWGPRWMEVAGDTGWHLILQDDVESQPDAVWLALCTFLQITPIPLPATGRSRVYEGGAPRSRHLAFLLSSAAHLAQGLGLHHFVDYARRSPLRAVMAGGSPLPELREKDREELKRYYRNDVTWVEDQCQRKLESWH